MTSVVPRTAHWQVSTHARGEVLTIGAAEAGLDLRVLAPSGAFDALETESWLAGLARAVDESCQAAMPGDPIPPMLRHALGALLFTHAEIWNAAAAPIFSLVMLDRDGRIGIGWVGSATVDAFVDGVPTSPEWVTVRDGQGREARAACFESDRDVRIVLTVESMEPGGDAIRIEAAREDRERALDRSASFAEEPLVSESAQESVGASAAEIEPQPSVEPEADSFDLESSVPPDVDPDLERPSSGVARWLAHHLQWEPDTPGLATPPADTGPEPAPSTMSEMEPVAAEPMAGVEAEPKSAAMMDAETRSESDESLLPPATRAEALVSGSVAADAPPSGPRDRIARHPDWPEVGPERPRRWLVPALWAGLAVVLLAIGWGLGNLQRPHGPAETRPSSKWVVLMRRLGLAPARFTARIESEPPGAWIALDGRDLQVRTPHDLELPVGEHRVELSFRELGSAAFPLRGGKNESVSLRAPLWGGLEVVASDPEAVVAVALDGENVGYAPLHFGRVAPGAHELRFTGPGMASWGTTVEVRLGETKEVLAYPLQSPATGLLQVRASRTAMGENQSVTGARVWIDGEPRGLTPLTLELPRGPHSVRVSAGGEEAPIQVIDLPGGNQRFAAFELGSSADLPRIALRGPLVFSARDPTLVSATLVGMPAKDVKEMWLHVRTPEGRWRRYEMTLLDAQGSAVGATPFPVSLLGTDRTTRYYVSALTSQGDEHFTELLVARAAGSR